jgi:glutathione S-transferase
MSQMENQNQEYGLAQRELAVKSLGVYDKIIASREYIAGERFTYADIQMVTSLQFLVRLNRLDIKDYENLNDYINQVSSRSSFSV